MNTARAASGELAGTLRIPSICLLEQVRSEGIQGKAYRVTVRTSEYGGEQKSQTEHDEYATAVKVVEAAIGSFLREDQTCCAIIEAKSKHRDGVYLKLWEVVVRE